jgi:hypothetical protein
VSRWTGRTIPASGSPEEAERVVGVLAILEEAGYLEISEPNTEPGSRFMRDLDGLPAGDVTTNGGPPADDIDIVDDEEGFGSWQSG